MDKIMCFFRNIIIAILFAVLLLHCWLLVAKFILKQPFPTAFGFSHAIVLSGSMQPTFFAGDMLFFCQQEQYQIGDVVIFLHGTDFITHRIVGEQAGQFITKGDFNNTEDANLLPPEQVFGEVVFVLPRVGALFQFLKTPLGMLLLLMLGLFIWEIPHITNYLKIKERHIETQKTNKTDLADV